MIIVAEFEVRIGFRANVGLKKSTPGALSLPFSGPMADDTDDVSSFLPRVSNLTVVRTFFFFFFFYLNY